MENRRYKHESQWMAIYTRPRAEKKVAKRLTSNDIENYVPLKKVRRQWSDRIKWVEVPIIPSYVFVRCMESDWDQILKTDGVVCFVCNEGKPAKIRDNEMKRMWKFLADIDRMTRSVAVFKPGVEVRIEAGPLRGKTGKVLHTKDTRVCISIESLRLQLRAEIESVLVTEKKG